MRRTFFYIFAALLLLALAGCPADTKTLKPRALDFVHKAWDVNAVTSFMTPIFQESMKGRADQPTTVGSGGTLGAPGGTGSAIPGPAPQLARLGQDALSKITEADLTIQAQKKWAQVTVGVNMDYGREEIKMVWLYVDKQWYVYAGSGGEENAYGKAPYFVD
jgi:hypothetical protein